MLTFEFQKNSLRQEEPGYLTGIVRINGAYHHVELYRVEEVNGVQEVWYSDDDPLSQNGSRYEALQYLYGGRYTTTEVPGFEGTYVLVMFPYAD